MATVAIMLGGAVLNVTTFIGGSYLAKYFSGDDSLAEKKRHDIALEKYQDYAKYQKNGEKYLIGKSRTEKTKKSLKRFFKTQTKNLNYTIELIKTK